MRRRFSRENISRVRSGPGVYRLFSKHAKKPTYIGMSNELPRRLAEHKNSERYHSFDVRHTDSIRRAGQIERRSIRQVKPRRNRAYA